MQVMTTDVQYPGSFRNTCTNSMHHTQEAWAMKTIILLVIGNPVCRYNSIKATKNFFYFLFARFQANQNDTLFQPGIAGFWHLSHW